MEPYSKGQLWAALKKAWTGFRIAKAHKDTVRMKEYAERINSLQGRLGLAKSEFKIE